MRLQRRSACEEANHTILANNVIQCNKVHHRGIKMTPYEATLGIKMTLGIGSTSTWPKQLLYSLQTEDDLAQAMEEHKV